jgi:hypothetical protein
MLATDVSQLCHRLEKKEMRRGTKYEKHKENKRESWTTK